MKRRYLVLFLLAALSACKKQPPRPDQYEYRIFVEGQPGLVRGVEMGGKPLDGGRQEARGTSYSVKVPAAEHAADRAFTVLVATSCGTEKIPATLALGISRAKGVDAEERERSDTKPGESVLTELEYEAPAVARIHIDTDGAGSAKVEVGAIALSTSKNEHDAFVGTCPAAKEIKVDGKVVGALNDKTRIVTENSGKRVEVPGTTLIDPTGKHCYEVLLHIYTEKDLDTSNMDRSAPKRLERAHVYQEDIDDFLKASPEEMKSEDGWPTRYEIRRCAAKGGRKK